MEEKKFKTGDKVILISGGPIMTAIGYEPKESIHVTCQWFDKGGLQEKSFHQDALKKYEAPKLFFGTV